MIQKTMMDNASGTVIKDTLRSTLQELGWDPEPTDLPGAFHIDFGPPHLPISTGLATVATQSRQFILYLNFGFIVPPNRRNDVLRCIARINWGLIIGNFELDLDDGHLRFKSSFDFDGTEFTSVLIRNATLAAMSAVDVHAESLVNLSTPRFTDETP